MHTLPAYKTIYGASFCGDSLALLSEVADSSVSLVMTSPPFVLQRPKEYGNLGEEEYLDWMLNYGRLIKQKLREDGSLVIDLGGAYQKGVPSRSLYNFRLLLRSWTNWDSILRKIFTGSIHRNYPAQSNG